MKECCLEQMENGYLKEIYGRYFVAMPDTSGNMDALAHLRGSENLLMDILVNPEPVKDALRKIQEAWQETIDRAYTFHSYPSEDTKSREKTAHSNKYKGNGSADGEFVIKRTLFGNPN